MLTIKRDMTEENVTAALLWFILPLTAGNIIQQLYNIVDIFIVGHYLGRSALASVGAVSNIIFLFNAVMIGLKSGIAVISSGDYGRKDYISYLKSIRSAKLLIGIGIAVTLLTGLVGGNLILKFIQVPEEVWDSSILYFKIIVLGYPFLFVFNYGSAIMQSIGNSKIVFLSLAGSTMVNVILDVVFVRISGYGVAGAALATVISQMIPAIILLFALKTDAVMREIKKQGNRSVSGPSVTKIREILQVSLPAMLQQGILAIGVVSITALINKCGTEMIAGVTVAGKIEGIVTMPVVTIGEALAVFTAQNIGAGKWERVQEGLKSAIKICGVMGIALSVLVVCKGKFLIGLFLDQYNDMIIEKGYCYMMSIMVMIFFMIPFRCFIGVATGMKNMMVVLVSFGLNILGRVTSAYILFPVVKEYAIYLANPFSVLIGTITVVLLYTREAQAKTACPTQT